MNEENKNIDNTQSKDKVEDIEATTTKGTDTSTESSDVDNDTDEEVDDMLDVANDADETSVQPLLHALDFEQSESRTTNIPPRLPLGYSYGTDNKTTKSTKKTKAKSSATPHPDLPSSTDALQNMNERPERSKRYRQRKPNKAWAAFKVGLKRLWGWILIVLIIITIAATYQLWLPMVKGWQHNEEDMPAIAADSLPKTVQPTKADSIITTLSHEDSLRIQDSIRHARWLYWKRRKQAQQQAEQEEQSQNSEEAIVPTTEHTTVHANDSLHH